MNYQKHSQISQISANPLARQRTSILWVLGVALILGLLLAVSVSAVPTASAAQPAIVSVTLDGITAWPASSPPTAVPIMPGADIKVVIIHNGGGNWTTTSWSIGTWDGGQMVGIPDVTLTAGCDDPLIEPVTMAQFSMTAPSNPGTYDLQLIAHNSNCGNAEGADVGGVLLTLALEVDDTFPTVTVEQAFGQLDPTNQSPIEFTVTFSEPVIGFDFDSLTLTGTALPTAATVTGNGTDYTVSVSGMSADGTVILSVDAGVVTDAAGNPNDASTSFDNQVTYDGTAPSVTIMTPPVDAEYEQGVEVFSDFSCDDAGGSGIDTCVATVDGGSAFNSGSLIDTATLGEHTLTVTATDLAGNVATLDRIYTVPGGPADATTSTITASPSSITADGTSTSTVTVQLFDANGNPLVSGGDNVSFSTDLGSLTSFTDLDNGSYTAILTSTTTTGLATVTGTLGPLDIGSATVTFTVTPVNDAPVAGDDSATTDEGGSVTTFVLSNDADADGDVLTVTGVTQGSNGTTTLNPDGSVTYTHNGSETTSDSYTYTVSDGNGGSDSATVSITVTPVNDAPVPVTPPPPGGTSTTTSNDDDDDDDDDDDPPVIPVDPGPGGSPNDNSDSSNDRDGDGFSDTIETDAGSDPDDPNSTPNDRDGDGYSNQTETDAGSDPDNADSTPDDRDGDGFSNDVEVAAGSDPDDPNSTPNNVRPEITPVPTPGPTPVPQVDGPAPTPVPQVDEPTPTPVPQVDEPTPTPAPAPAPAPATPEPAPATPAPPITSGGGGAGGAGGAGGGSSLGTNLAIVLGSLAGLLALLLLVLAKRRRRRQVQEALGPRIQ